jgi:membrane protein required for colicin V production
MAYDLFMLVIVLYTTVRGASRGMAWQLAAIASLVLCFLFATPLSLTLAPVIGLQPPLDRWVAMLVIYLLFSFVCFGAARMLRSWLEQLKLVEYDRHLGAAFGVVKGVTLCFVVTFFTVCLSERLCEYVMQTRTGYASAIIMKQLEIVMPHEIADVLAPYAEHFEHDHAQGHSHEDLAADSSGNAAPRPSTDNNFAGYDSDPWAGAYRDPSRPAPSPPQPADTEPPSLGALMKQLPGLLGDQLRNKLLDGLQGALNPQSQPASNAEITPAAAPVSSAPQPQGNNPDLTASLQRLSQGVAAIFSSDPQIQANTVSEIQESLRGVPSQVANAVLEDWHADLVGASDPDPNTDLSSTLEQRITRQLNRAGLSVEQLPAAMRERLRETR